MNPSKRPPNHDPVPSDEEIIEMYWKRNEAAIKETDRKYGTYLFHLARNIVHDESDCEECLNDTYLGTWNRIPPTRPNALQAFLARIMRNIAIDRFRSNTAARHVPSELTDSLDELDESIRLQYVEEEDEAARDVARILNEYIDSLPRRREFVFVCRYYFADSVEHIADLLNVSKVTISRELAAIRRDLREKLEKEGYTI